MRLINEIAYAHEHILTRVNKLQKFSSEFEVPCPFVKLFDLEQFAIYSIINYGILYKGLRTLPYIFTFLNQNLCKNVKTQE